MVLGPWFLVLGPFPVLGPSLVPGPWSVIRCDQERAPGYGRTRDERGTRYQGRTRDQGRTKDQGRTVDQARTEDQGRTRNPALRTKDQRTCP